MKKDVRKTRPLEAASYVVGGKWKSVILYRLLNNTVRFNELLRSIPDVTRRMLTLQLRELEKDGLISRKVYHQVPPKVEYSLTSLGKALEENLELLRQWGEKYLKSKNQKSGS